MNNINIYLFNLTLWYLFLNLLIISIFIIFINLLELSRIIPQESKTLFNFLYLSFLKYPSILNEIIPFVTIVGISFLIRNLINNNELISMRNLGYSIFDIFLPISFATFLLGVFFLLFLNPFSVFLESKYDIRTNHKENSLYSIKISNNEMWIKNKDNALMSSFINIKNIDLKDMYAKNIKILLINDNSNKFIIAKNGKIKKNIFLLENVKYYDFKYDNYKDYEKFNLPINFSEENILNSISKYKLIPFYKYINHTKTLTKFNLYSPEIGLYYLSEVFKPVYIVLMAFVMIGFTSKFQRNENFFKILFVSISMGFIIFLITEIIGKLTISLYLNVYLSYVIIFLFPFLIGVYQFIKLENE